MQQTNRPCFEVTAFASLGDRNTITPRPGIDTIQDRQARYETFSTSHICAWHPVDSKFADNRPVNRNIIIAAPLVLDNFQGDRCCSLTQVLRGIGSASSQLTSSSAFWLAYYLLSRSPQSQQYLDLLEFFKIGMIPKQNNVSREQMH